jgi:uncharacterized protein DUF6687
MIHAMTRAVVDGFFVIGSAGLRPPAERILYADGSAGPEFRAGTDLELSHWVPNTTPSRWAADTSTEICLRFAADPPSERYRLAINNHVDVDGILSVFALAHSPLALEHRAVVVGAAEMGDFYAGVDRAAFRLAHELTLLISESRARKRDAQETYAKAFEIARGVLTGERPEPEAVGSAWAILERGRERIDAGEVRAERFGEHFVAFTIPHLSESDLARALRVPPFNPLIDESVWLWPHSRNHDHGQCVQLVSVLADDGWFHDLWLPGYVWAETPDRWRVPGLRSTGDSNVWSIEHPALFEQVSTLRTLERNRGRWGLAETFMPFHALEGRGFPVIASFVDPAGAPAASSLEPRTVASILAPAFAD